MATSERESSFEARSQRRFSRATDGPHPALPPSLLGAAASEVGAGRASATRILEERRRRHRERAIAAWLRDLSR